MKLITLGLGQCGSRISDEFARLNHRAQAYRRIQIVPGAFAINTDAADLSGLSYISPDYQHRIVIGGRKTSGHGVGKINELGAEIARSEGDKVIDAVRTVKNLFEADGFLIVASTGGGTGSGSIAIITKYIKERYTDMPVYALLVLPFEHEEATEERTIYNTATCLKSVSSVAD
ncbi:MAG: cell division protein FtsZ, partial [Chloroflexota bacterium]